MNVDGDRAKRRQAFYPQPEAGVGEGTRANISTVRIQCACHLLREVYLDCF